MNPDLVFASAAFWLLWDERWHSIFQAVGVRPEEWPEDLPREVAEKYLKFRQTGHSHAFAQHTLTLLSDQLEPKIWHDFPRDEDFFRDVYQKAILKWRATKLSRRLREDPDHAEQHVTEYITHASQGIQVVSAEEAINGLFERRIKDRTTADVIELPGWRKLSAAIGGFNPGRLMILMADTGFGKTNLGINLGTAASELGATFYLNMEMILDDFTSRIVTAKTGQHVRQAIRTDLDAKFVAQSLDNLFWTDGRDLTLHEVRGVVRRFIEKHKARFVFIDYDQKFILPHEKGVPEWQQLQRAFIGLEGLAKELDVFICVLAQTNADGEISGSRRSMFPASTVLRFYKHKLYENVIEAVKNRFGRRNAGVTVQYDPAKSFIAEGSLIESVAPEVVRGFM